MNLAKLGIKVLEKVSIKLIRKISDEKIRNVLDSFIEMILMVVEVFIDDDKENKAQLEALKPQLKSKAYEIIGLLLDLED